MAVNVGSLAVSLSADGTALAHGLDAAALRVTAFERSATKSATTSEVAMSASFGRIAASAGMAAARIAAFGTGAVVTGLAGAAVAAQAFARSLAEVGDKAKMSGLSNRAFQELSYVAKSNRIEIDALADGLKELSLRSDEFIKTGGGPAAESLARLGFTASDLAERLKDPSALLTEIIGRVQQLDRAAQIRIFDELFGGQGGEKFVQLISQGADGLRRTVAEAHAVGAVLSDEVLAKADEIDRKFTAITTTIGMGMKSAIVDAVSAVDDLIEGLKKVEDQSTNRLQDRLANIGAERVDIENKILGLKAQDREGIGGAWGADNSAIISTLEDQMKALAEEESRILDTIEKRRSANVASSPAPTVTPLPAPFMNGVTPPTPLPDPRKSLDYISGYDEVMKKAREATAQLQMERQALGLTTVEADALRRSFELLNEVQAQNGEVTPQQRREIIALASQQARLADENDRLKASTEDFAKSAQQGFESVASSIGAALARTKDWKSVLSEVIMLLVNLAAKWAGPKIAGALGVGGGESTSAVANAVSSALGKTSSAATNDNVSTSAVARAVDLAAQREALGMIESGGRYDALGVLTKSGDRAYGKYQVMGSNVGPWTKDALGYSMTPNQFLSAPWAQDMVFNRQFGNSLAKYGNANDAASVWFTGRPLSQGAGATDILGTSGSQYVANFNSALEKTTGSLGNMNSTVDDVITSIGSGGRGGSSLLGGSTSAVAQSASRGPLDLGQFTGGGAGGGGFLTSLAGLFTNIFSGLGKMLSGLLSGASKGIGGFFSSIFGALFSANGNAFGPGGLTAFASGGVFTNSIVATPTVFKFANGGKFGVMGEAGEEAVMPLSRDGSGRLGVSLHGAMNDNWAEAMGGMAKVAAGAQMNGGSHVLQYRGGDTHIHGNVTEDIWPRVRAEIAMSAADTKKDIGRNFGSYQRMSSERD